MAERLDRRRVASRREESDQGRRLGLRERQELDRAQLLLQGQGLKCPAKHGIVGQLFIAGRGDDEDSVLLHTTTQKRQQTHAQLVRPVQIFQHEEHRLTGSKLLQELSDALEEPSVIDRVGRPRRCRLIVGPRQ